MVKYVILVMIVILSGCAVQEGPLFSEVSAPDETRSLVYFSRNSSDLVGAFPAEVIVGDKVLGTISLKGYMACYIPPGLTKIQIKSGNGFEYVANLETGRTYHFMMGANTYGGVIQVTQRYFKEIEGGDTSSISDYRQAICLQ